VDMPSTHISLLCALQEDGHRDEMWVVFSARYRDVILGWCLRRGLPPDAAEDLTQEVMLKLFQRLPEYRYDPARGQFRGWLKAVVGNTLTDFWRCRQRQPDGDALGGTAFLEQAQAMANPESVGELSVLLEDRAASVAGEVLARVRARVKETTWQAFYQTLVEERPAAEVAAALNLTVASVYKSTYRVKQLLLEEYRHVERSGDDPDTVPGPGHAG
jgi:RNA polymerase sigma factor (sigma-70 family)